MLILEIQNQFQYHQHILLEELLMLGWNPPTGNYNKYIALIDQHLHQYQTTSHPLVRHHHFLLWLVQLQIL